MYFVINGDVLLWLDNMRFLAPKPCRDNPKAWVEPIDAIIAGALACGILPAIWCTCRAMSNKSMWKKPHAQAQVRSALAWTGQWCNPLPTLPEGEVLLPSSGRPNCQPVSLPLLVCLACPGNPSKYQTQVAASRRTTAACGPRRSLGSSGPCPAPWTSARMLASPRR